MPEAISALLGFEPQAMLAALTRAGFELNALQVDGSLSRFEPSNLGERGYVDLLCLRSRS
ncbi:MAG: hypothetical protein IPJ65_43230 [Archangiaceae bacterium]|nr:hypothetical protein [Archangiaceae bacterium]